MVFKSIVADALYGFTIAKAAVTLAPAAHHVETFQGKPGRINVAVAGGTAFLAAMLSQLLANGGGTADIGLERRYIRRGRRWWFAQQPGHHPGAAFDW